MTRLIDAIICAIALFLILWLALGPVRAQVGECLPLEILDATVTKHYGEYRWGWGVIGENKVKFYRNPETGSWTLAILPRPEMACLLATGKGFVEDIEDPPVGGKNL